MDEACVKLEIYSPRLGHMDTYEVNLTGQSLVISQGPRKAECILLDDGSVEWRGESLEKILRNDTIYPPSILPDLFVHAWRSWRNGDLDNFALDRELKVLAVWLYEVCKAKPNTEFWNLYF